MNSLSLTLFDRFQAHLGHQPLPGFRTNKVQALLIYLVVESGRHSRESLMDLLWPGMPERSARHNLRQVLYYLRGAIPEVGSSKQGEEGKVPLLQANRKMIRLNNAADVSTDAARFETLVEGTLSHDHLELLTCQVCRSDLEGAIALYQGDFLADFYLDDSNEFEDWALVRREAYRRRALDALEVLTTIAIRQQDYPGARSLAERQLEIDNLRESSYRQLMELLALSGRREEALAVYESCRRLLAEELSMEPARRTTQMYEKILAGDLSFDTPSSQGVRGYELKEEIGQGAYGTIHRAIQSAIGREVAVKVIRPRYANNPEFIRRFEDEAQIVARLEHPFIVPLHDYWRDPDGAYLVMRYLKGGSLLSALEEGPWNPEPALQMLEQVASALSAAHQMGIIHRDIKPANILLDGAGNAYLSDFGIAKGVDGDRRLTAAGAILGTPDYISPEQILDKGVSPQSDLYSLGAVLFETLTGEKPFQDSSVANLIYKQLHEPFPMVSASRPDLPPDIDAVILKATAKRPADRYTDALEMAEAFRAALSGGQESLSVPVAIPAGVETYNPYKGLQAFQEADADDFFGRDALVDRLVARLAPAPPHPGNGRAGANGRFLALVGPSGSGKSSAVKAGLIPALRAGAIPGSEKWFVAEMVPGTHPLEELEMALWPVAVDPPPSLVAPMQRDVRGMLRTIRRIMPDEEGAGLLLVIDQFEELFTLVEDADRRAFFLESLLTAISAERSPLRVLITLRADFYDRPLQLQSFGQLLKESTEIVLPLTAEELTWAVREPARRVGVSLEEGLAEAVVADVVDEPGGLPLLQYALTELFERRENGRMTRTAYQEIGGVLGALGKRAEEIYGGLDTVSQEAARQMFLRLVTLGEGVEDTRRRVLRDELEELLTVNGEQLTINNRSAETHSQFTIHNSPLDIILDPFGQARLLTFDRDPMTRRPTVEVAHEALLREWKRLRDWLEESRDDVRTQRMLARAAGEWLAAGKEDSYLLHGARLSHFEAWAAEAAIALTGEESDFLAASIAAREERRSEEEARRGRELETARALAETEAGRAEERASAARRLRRRAYFLAGVVVIALVLAVTAALFGQASSRNANLAATREAEALDQKSIAEQQQATAEEQALVARSRELAAASGNSLHTDPELGILLAQQAFSTARTVEAEQALHSALLTSRVRMRLVGHQRPLERIAYSPDGALIALASYGEELATIWDAASGQKLFEIPVAGCCWGLYFDDDGRRLAMVESGENFSIAIWDMTTGQKIRSYPLPVAVSDLQGGYAYYLNPDWTQVVLILKNAELEVWALREGRRLFELPGHADANFIEIEYSQDGQILVSYDGPGFLVIVWDALTGEPLAQIDVGKPITDHAISPDGRWVALSVALGAVSEVQIWNLDELRAGDEPSPPITLTDQANTIRLLAYSPDGRLIASAGRDGTSRIWDTVTGKQLAVLPHGERVRSVIFHPDGNSILTGDFSGVARVWDITTEGSSERLTVAAHDQMIKSAALSPDDNYVVTGSWDGTAKIWDSESGELIHLLEGHTHRVMSVAYRPDGRRVATASSDNTALIWDATTGAVLIRLEGHGEGIVGGLHPGVLGVAYSPDGRRLATAGADGTARIWDGDSGAELLRLDGHQEGMTSVRFSPDGRYLATGSDGPEVAVRLWDARTGQELFAILAADDSRIWGLDFSPDGRFLASGGGDTTARIWALDYEAKSAELRATLRSHANTVISVRFSPDGRMLATATNGEIRLWDIEGLLSGGGETTVSELLVLPGEPGLVFTGDSRELISGSPDGLLRVYLLDTGELMALARSRLTRWWTEAECQQYLHTDECPPAPTNGS